MNCYILHLASEQIKITLNKKKINDLLTDNKTDADTLAKLKFVKEIRAYAMTDLFLNGDGGYLYYYNLNREEIGWNVSASEPLEFKSYTWWFPFAGTVPYKGFFDLEKAKEEENKLKEMNLDTRVRITGGYSTLGWFSDPIFSTHLHYAKDDLVALVIHEMAHATVYFPGDATFNESYATFVEEEGVKRYFTKEGTESRTLQARKENNYLSAKIREMITRTGDSLDKLYKSNRTEKEKYKLKKELIQSFKESIINDKSLARIINKEKFQKKEINNEDFIGITRYHSGGNFFKNKLNELNGDFKKFHQEIKKLESLSPEKRQSLLANT